MSKTITKMCIQCNYTLEFAVCTKNMELLKLHSKEKTIFFAKSSWYLLTSDV